MNALDHAIFVQGFEIQKQLIEIHHLPAPVLADPQKTREGKSGEAKKSTSHLPDFGMTSSAGNSPFSYPAALRSARSRRERQMILSEAARMLGADSAEFKDLRDLAATCEARR